MASSTAQAMPKTIEAYKKLAARDLELIEEQQKEIGKLKAKVNKLEQKYCPRMVRNREQIS